jgi:hypothetical protein
MLDTRLTEKKATEVRPPGPSLVAPSLSPQVQLPPMGLLAGPDGPLSDMLDRLALPRPTAVERSHEMWPDRLEGSQNVAGYLEWYERVRPGGTLHRDNGHGERDDLLARGKSTKDMSQAMISTMDRFHRTRAGLGEDVSQEDSQLPAGARCDPFESLGPFFHPVRCYGM